MVAKKFPSFQFWKGIIYFLWWSEKASALTLLRSSSQTTLLMTLSALEHSHHHRHDDKRLVSMTVESNLRNRGFKYTIGSDEAGRGCIAGPVVTASCCILAQVATDDHNELFQPILGVNDSKQLNEKSRSQIYQEMLEQPDVYAWRVAERSNVDIEASNIVKATMDSFQESIEGLVSHYHLPLHDTYCIVDGNTRPKLSIPVPCRAWVRGDAEVYSVALASVIAKVVRDRLMIQAHEVYPQYGFDIHKGYPTREHIVALHKYGPCSLHRMSFKPLKGR
jgi:ribonuclease HII